VGFIDGAYANDLHQRRSTTSFAFLLAGGAVAYKSQTQTITATCSTEAEFLAAVSATKTALYLRAVLSELDFPQSGPTILYEDNDHAAITMITARPPTDRACHLAIQHFAMQDRKDAGHIVLSHIPGILNLSDNLTKPLGWV
jgi:hypothetical protein